MCQDKNGSGASGTEASLYNQVSERPRKEQEKAPLTRCQYHRLKYRGS